MSNAFDKASLVMLPHAYEEGKVYSLKPTDRSGDFTYSRGTDTATRVGEDGYIKKEYGNVLEQSNTFSDAIWTKSSVSVAGGQTGYDGTNDAWNLIPATNITSSHRMYLDYSSAGGVFTFSFYAKANGYDFLRLNNYTGTVLFNLSNGTIESEAAIDGSIESVGNGWYRISVAESSPAGNLRVQLRVQIDAINSGYAGDGVSGVLIQDAMLNQGLVAYPYLETTTAPVYGGLTDDMPRLDYSGGATCPSLLLEPSRTNVVPQSEYITSSSGLATIEYNGGISPEGVSNAIRVIENTSTSFHTLNSSATISSTNSHTLSVFVKTDGVRNTINLRSGISTNIYTSSVFTLSGSGSYAGSDGGIKSYGNGWYRIHWTFSHTQTGTATLFFNASYYAGTGQEWFFYGAQLEQGSYPTSYIPTYGSSQTRAREDMQSNTSSLGITDEFTFFIDTNGMQVTGTSLNSMDDLRWYSQSNYYYRFYKTSDSSFISNIVKVDDRTKIALKITASECKTFVDGALDSTIALSTPFSSFNQIKKDSADKFKDSFNQILLFPTALSDDQCIALTTL